MLEPYDGKLSRTVLRGACGLVTVLWAGNGPRLPVLPIEGPGEVEFGRSSSGGVTASGKEGVGVERGVQSQGVKADRQLV